MDSPVEHDKEEQEQEFEFAQLVSFLETNQILSISETDLRLLLKSHGLAQAVETLRYYRDARDGILHPVSKCPNPQGFQNAGNTCYIDSVLFALFARESVFDALVTKISNDEKVSQLQVSLRIAVNLLRTNKLVSSWVMSKLRADLVNCGWITGTGGSVVAPFLPLERKLFHGGKSDTDDERLSTERILVLSIPEKDQDIPAKYDKADLASKDKLTLSLNIFPKGKKDPNRNITADSPSDSLLLEDLLTRYFFDNKINVERCEDDKGSLIMRVTDAWQMNRLFPFFTPQNEAGDQVDISSADFDNKNVIIPILLKIPFGLFVTGESVDSEEEFSNYTLRLRSVVCHQGTSPRSGHYMSFLQMNTSTSTIDEEKSSSRNQSPSRTLPVINLPESEDEKIFEASCVETSSSRDVSPARSTKSETAGAYTPQIVVHQARTTNELEWLRFDDMMTSVSQARTSHSTVLDSVAASSSVEKDQSKVNVVKTIRDATNAMQNMSANGYLVFYELVPSQNLEQGLKNNVKSSAASTGSRDDERKAAQLQVLEFEKENLRKKKQENSGCKLQ
ncbi:hypothetical protein HK096_001386 [Nowakowskiella sp. JEL0078]|nr:hypothetical protein HK096_001386 [Nowakowskiella sp. JEL0078]